MSSRTWFGSRYLENGITFTTPAQSTWVPVRKLSEIESRISQEDMLAGLGYSYARASFLCHNVHNSTHEAILRVYKQVPNIGTEADEPEDRQLQATRRIHQEVDTMERLTEEHECAYVPAWLGSKIEEQGDHDIVPHGYINYILWEKVPGVHLCNPDENFVLFWSLPRQERDRIRTAFVITYQKLYTIGICPVLGGCNNLIWDAQQDRIYVIGLDDVAECNAFGNVTFLEWGLATAPDGCPWGDEDFDDSSMEGWKL
ncbi:hypothetical protein Egran_04424 [Elaphomyces granulatus]|uniref:Aminoglycoside phosphotransferase domain-containing protein n=1 Tax=Elaphomyces granulatus TaxID=519963 RepID=A0A232LUL1_9EURO|nr:hypothetical protein Egran_04424 [Elaphomyces granulatus]